MQSLIKSQSMVPEIQMKRAKHDIHTYILTNQESIVLLLIKELLNKNQHKLFKN